MKAIKDNPGREEIDFFDDITGRKGKTNIAKRIIQQHAMSSRK